MVLITSPRFEDHLTPPGHPERPERARVFHAVAVRHVQNGGRIVAPRPATRHELEAAHTPGYLDTLAAARGRTVMLDADTFMSPQSVDVAELAAGAAVQAVEAALATRRPALALVRPPGHHAEASRAMGFCLFNSAAVAAAAALRSGIERVAIVDIDVHHGNGTEHIFYGDPRVLYVSSHQYPFYPGTGAAGDVGSGPGAGMTVNVPMEAGCTDGDYALVYRAVVVPVLEQFAPQVTIVSAGFDAHERDPLASMRLTTPGYGRLVGTVKKAAERSGPVAVVTEGGYDLTALSDCLALTCEVLQGRADGEAEQTAAAGRRGEHAVAVAATALERFWKL